MGQRKRIRYLKVVDDFISYEDLVNRFEQEIKEYIQ